MTLARKHQIKADECRAQAVTASDRAESSELATVRDMHLRAAAAWTEMAELQDRAAQDSERRLAAAALLARPPKAAEEDPSMSNSAQASAQ